MRENRRANYKWTIQRQWRHRVHKTQDEDKQTSKQTNKAHTQGKLKRLATRIYRKNNIKNYSKTLNSAHKNEHFVLN